METPICVTDAQTFIDHVHKIKKWIYSGQLRLIIPSSLPENVDQLYLKSIEPKPASKDSSKSKGAGRPAKKEYPAFDANPRVAKAFLARLQAGKDYETGHLGRPIYEEEEKHGAVHFAQAKEQYTPWKDVEVVEEKLIVPENHQETWADKLRRKQNAANGTLEKKVATGPVKPKLVAKTGVDNSPWKVQRNAPSIPATDVPANLRAMMSCALWRIHESIHRNDENQVFVLTDDTSVKDVAQKLNIIVHSTQQPAEYICSLKSPKDLDVFGELEEEFGIRPVKERRLIKAMTTTSAQQKDIGSAVGSQETESSGPDLAVESSPREIYVNAKKTSFLEPDILEPPSNDLSLGVGNHMLDVSIKTPDSSLANGDIKNGSLAGPEGESVIMPSVDLSKTSQTDLPVKAQEPAGPKEETLSDAGKAANNTPPPPAMNVWFRSFANALTGKQDSESEKPFIKAKNSPSTSSVTVAQPEMPKPAIQHVHQASGPSAHSLGTKEPCEESEDSEEEVVVFQPKRLSAQQKRPAQQHSRPTTPNAQAPSTVTTQSPRSGMKRGQQHAPQLKQYQPRPTNGMSPSQPKPAGTKPPVIDPDAFGRDFAVNTNSNPRGSVRGMRMRHSPRASLHSIGPSTSRPGSSHRQNRGSSDGSSPRVSPLQLAKTPVPLEEDVGAKPTAQMPIGTGRPSPSPAAETRLQILNANAPVFQPASSSPLPPAPVQSNSTHTSFIAPPQSMPPKQAPIGSGRPNSKSSQAPNGTVHDQQHKASNGPTPHQANDRQETANRTLHSNPRQNHDFVRQSSSGPRHPNPQQPVRTHTQTPPARPQPMPAVSGRQRGFQSGPQGKIVPRPIAPRPVKPSLFEPELDHTRAFQPDKLEPRKTVTPEVDYVLKSGSTREQTRGKGKLWVG